MKALVTLGLCLSVTLTAGRVYGERESGVNVQAQLADTLEDHASTQGIFYPGPGFNGHLLNDFHWILRLNLSRPRTISSILIEHAVGGEAWTTRSARWQGLDPYPIVVFKSGTQVNTRYDQAIGPLPAGSSELDLYGQIETWPFAGGHIQIEFTDGGSAQTLIAAPGSVEPLEIRDMQCQDSDGGAVYETKGQLSYQINGQRISFSDYCINDHLVAEGICGGRGRQFVLSHGNCQGVCADGACVQGQAQLDLEGRLQPLPNTPGAAWEFSFQTGRARSIQDAVILVSGVEGRVRSVLLSISFQGQVLGRAVFEPNQRWSVVLSAAEPASQLAGGSLWVSFTDGTKYMQNLP